MAKAASLANEAMWTVALQRRRLLTPESEDDDFVFRTWADWQFLIVALTRLRRAAMLAAHLGGGTTVRRAIARFDHELPAVRLMRDIAEHIDEYAIDSDRRHHRSVDRRGLQVGEWNDRQFIWHLDGELVIDADAAVLAAQELAKSVRACRVALAKD